MVQLHNYTNKHEKDGLNFYTSIKHLPDYCTVQNTTGLGTEIKMNIDINFSINVIHVLNIDIKIDIIEIHVLNIDINFNISNSGFEYRY